MMTKIRFLIIFSIKRSNNNTSMAFWLPQSKRILMGIHLYIWYQNDQFVDSTETGILAVNLVIHCCPHLPV